MQRPALEARGLTLGVERDAGKPQVRGDMTRLVQVFGNLMANAAKFTESGGRVTVRSWCDGDEAVVSVQDTGVGIPAALLPHVFDLFVQGERSLDRTQGGLGVGLTIVQSIVQQHGGSVRATSAGRDCGSQFEVRLPLMSESMPAGERARAPTAPAAGSLRVLVVDDNVDAAQALCSLVESWGHQVECVHGGREALACIPGFGPEALLLDIGLPGMNGYELARSVRQLPQAASYQLVAVTGYGDAEARLRSAQAGYDEHLTKPVDPDTLEQILAQHGSRQARQRPG
jgi:CheY-like chemotaxis protein